ncbi:MAG: lysine--tRNA ligase [bacterium]|nr:lysine--tRNA ligase [bacterium]
MSDDLIQSRLKKLETLREKGINPYPYSFPVDSNSQRLKERFEELAATQEVVSLAGRIMLVRRMGKACFMTIQDSEGAIQIYFKADVLGKEKFDLSKLLETGDIVGVGGSLFKTKTGEITIKVNDFAVLTKSIKPLPEKYHGLVDKELRYRQRSLDMIMNRDVLNVFKQRTLIMAAVRDFLNKRGYYEVEPPVLQPVYGGAEARPFTTHVNALNQDVFLSISPELYLKRFLAGGFEKVYALTKSFRNEGIDKSHNPEFTILESYEAYVDYNEIMKLAEQMIEHVCLKIKGATRVEYQGMEIDFKTPWKRIKLFDAIREFTEVDCRPLSHQRLCEEISRLGLGDKVDFDQEKGFLILEIFEHCVQPKLIQPTFVYDYPGETSPLCKVHRDDPALIERFEPIVCGMELGNAFSELNDPILQRTLMEDQAQKRQAGLETAAPMDEYFVEAIELGMPPAGGLGIGIDRLVMLLTDSASIRDVIAFPFMRQAKEE